jgi:hypothetical protein
MAPTANSSWRPGQSFYYLVERSFQSGYFPFNWKCIGRKDLTKSNMVVTILAQTMPNLAPALLFVAPAVPRHMGMLMKNRSDVWSLQRKWIHVTGLLVTKTQNSGDSKEEHCIMYFLRHILYLFAWFANVTYNLHWRAHWDLPLTTSTNSPAASKYIL